MGLQKYDLTALSLVRRGLESGGAATLTVSTKSMSPSLLPEDKITVKASCVDCLNPGDIAVFCRDGSLIAHRVIKKKTFSVNRFIITKPDRGLCPDSPVSGSEIIGKVVSVKRGLCLMDYRHMPYSLFNFLAARISYFQFLIYRLYRFIKHPASCNLFSFFWLV